MPESTYSTIWHDHIRQLVRLKWNLPEEQDRERLDSIMADLYELADKAAEENKKA